MSIRDLFVEIGMDIDDGPLGDLDRRINDVIDRLSRMDLGGLDDLENGVDDLIDEFEDLDDRIDDVDDGLDDLNDDSLRDVERGANDADGAFGKLKGTIIGIGAAIGAYIAVDKIIEFGASAIEAAAGAQALNAQFEQVFGDIQGQATESMEQLGKDFGMLPSRIQGPLTQTTSMFKGLGLDTKEALGMAERAVTTVADAAAFYDKSFEDANSALNSFIKGNYEGGESIGLFANDTQLAVFAVKEGVVSATKEWSSLDEATKQATRLEYAENMQELAGATGQAARESGGYENVLGNLKQAWQDFLAKVGDPILEQVLSVMSKLGHVLGNIDPGPFMEFISVGFGKLVEFKNTISEMFGILKDVFLGNGLSFDNAMTLYGKLGIPPEVVEGIVEFGSEVRDAFTFAKDVVSQFVNDVIVPLIPVAQEFIGVAFEYIGNIVSGAMNIFDAISGIIRGLIENVIVPLFPVAQEIIAVAFDIISPILRIGGSLFEGLTAIIKFLVTEIIVPLFPLAVSAIEGAWAILKPILEAISKAFSGIADAVEWVIKKLGSVGEAIKNFDVGEKISGVVSKVTSFLPGFEIGLGRVPFDEMPALLHKDEAVLPADEADKLRDRGILQGDGTHPEINLDQATQFEPAKDYTTTETINNTSSSSKVSAPIQIIVQGSNNPQETAYSVKDTLEELFGDLLSVMPVPREG